MSFASLAWNPMFWSYNEVETRLDWYGDDILGLAGGAIGEVIYIYIYIPRYHFVFSKYIYMTL